jgi:hypothetical protein
MYDHADSLRKQDWEVRDVAHNEARAFIAEYHYARGCSHTRVYGHGLYRRGEDTLYGVALWLPPTRPAAESVNRDSWRKVISLTRLACCPAAPKNAASFLLSRSVALIRADGRFLSLVTYADERMGHTGAIYRAANWTYCGRMKGSPAWVDPQTGRQVATQATKTRTKAEMISLGYRQIGTFAKHKFVLHLPEQQPATRIASLRSL